MVLFVFAVCRLSVLFVCLRRASQLDGICLLAVQLVISTSFRCGICLLTSSMGCVSPGNESVAAATSSMPGGTEPAAQGTGSTSAPAGAVGDVTASGLEASSKSPGNDTSGVTDDRSTISKSIAPHIV